MNEIKRVDWRMTSWLFQGDYTQFKEDPERAPDPCGHISVIYTDESRPTIAGWRVRQDEFGFGTAETAKGLARALGVPCTRNGSTWGEGPSKYE